MPVIPAELSVAAIRATLSRKYAGIPGFVIAGVVVVGGVILWPRISRQISTAAQGQAGSTSGGYAQGTSSSDSGGIPGGIGSMLSGAAAALGAAPGNAQPGGYPGAATAPGTAPGSGYAPGSPSYSYQPSSYIPPATYPTTGYVAPPTFANVAGPEQNPVTRAFSSIVGRVGPSAPGFRDVPQQPAAIVPVYSGSQLPGGLTQRILARINSGPPPAAAQTSIVAAAASRGRLAPGFGGAGDAAVRPDLGGGDPYGGADGNDVGGADGEAALGGPQPNRVKGRYRPVGHLAHLVYEDHHPALHNVPVPQFVRGVGGGGPYPDEGPDLYPQQQPGDTTPPAERGTSYPRGRASWRPDLGAGDPDAVGGAALRARHVAHLHNIARQTGIHPARLMALNPRPGRLVRIA